MYKFADFEFVKDVAEVCYLNGTKVIGEIGHADYDANSMFLCFTEPNEFCCGRYRCCLKYRWEIMYFIVPSFFFFIFLLLILYCIIV